MKNPNFRAMTPEEFNAYHPRTEEEEASYEAESEFREWCNEGDEDPQDEGAYERYREQRDEVEGFWDKLDENDRAGYEDNMNRD